MKNLSTALSVLVSIAWAQSDLWVGLTPNSNPLAQYTWTYDISSGARENVFDYYSIPSGQTLTGLACESSNCTNDHYYTSYINTSGSATWVPIFHMTDGSSGGSYSCSDTLPSSTYFTSGFAIRYLSSIRDHAFFGSVHNSAPAILEYD
jgi:hypothetical protein